MEIANLLKGSKKGQMMSTLVLLMFLLMLVELFAFLTLDVNYNGIGSAQAISQGAQSIGTSLTSGSHDFASKSLQAAISALASYEYNPALRKTNFISNFSYYVSNLMISGIIPNATLAANNAIGVQMVGLTLKAYNLSVIKAFNTTGGRISINESTPIIYQNSSTAISVRYTERVFINTSSGTYNFGIPVNATLNLAGEPDFYYFEQGVQSYVNFANLSSLTSLAGNVYAQTGSPYNFVYGTTNVVVGSNSCPTGFGASANSIILVAQNAVTITSSGCENGFGGLITTANTISSTPKVPYLGYPSGVNFGSFIRSGENFLLYGPELATLSIEGLRTAVNNGYYVPASGAASYIQRANDQLSQGSPQGMFNFIGYNQQVFFSNGTVNTLITVPRTSSLEATNTFSLSWWFYTPQSSTKSFYQEMVSSRYSADTTFDMQLIGGNADAQTTGLHGDIGNGAGTWLSTAVNYPFSFQPDKWYNLVLGFTQSGWNMYLNGNMVSSGTYSGNPSLLGPTDNLYIGYCHITECNFLYSFNGSMANLQIYNTSLSKKQVAYIYQQGISGLPVSNAGLVGWWPLNGNANDYSGQGNTGIPTNVIYALAPSGLPSVSAGKFNGATSYISTGTTGLPSSSSARSVFAWVYYTGNSPTYQPIFAYGTASSKESSELSAYVNNEICFNDFSSNNCATGFTSNSWSMVGYTYASGASTATVYINGVGTTVTPDGVLSTVVGTAAIGVREGDTSNIFNGLISNVQVYSTALSSGQVTQLYDAGIGGAPAPNAGIVAWWPLNGNANDYSGDSNAGTPIGVTFAQVPGQVEDSILAQGGLNVYPLPGVLNCYNIGTCYNGSLHNMYLSNYPIGSKQNVQDGYFNGTSEHYIYANVPGVNTANGGYNTASFWMNWTGRKGTSGETPFSFYSYDLTFYPGTSCFGFNTVNNDDYGISNSNSIANTMVYVTAVFYNGAYTGQNKLYINGQQQTLSQCQGSAQSGSATSTVQISGIPNDPGIVYFNGSISNLQLYNTSLSSNQIATLYGEGITGAPLASKSLVGWWPLNGNANDYSGNGADGLVDQNVVYPYILHNASSVQSFWQEIGLGTVSK